MRAGQMLLWLSLIVIASSWSLRLPLTPYRSSSALYSYGDPDLTSQSEWKNRISDNIRQIDKQLVFRDDPDVPHYTFLSPIRWAPWLETIWFGNLYDYRSAYFHDVMYSNNVPYKEGALLYKDLKSNTNMGLLYQRYLKFDTESYSVPNCTLYNIFGEKSVRLGRYKLPLTSTVILSVTDPLTYTEMKRYLTSFNMVKWFINQYFQAKRKRTYKFDIKSDTFLCDAIQQLEYGRILMDTGSSSSKSLRIPILPIDRRTESSMITSPVTRIHSHNDVISLGLAAPLAEANSQYFIENLIQSILQYEDQVAEILVGGDGRLYNNHVIDVITRVASANGVQRVLIPLNTLMTTSMARVYPKKQALTIVLTGGGNAAGIKGSFGMRVIASSGREYDEFDWDNVRTLMAANKQVNIVPTTNIARINRWTGDASLSVDKMTVNAVDVVENYLAGIRKNFNLPELKEGLSSNGISVVIDNSNTYLVTLLKPLLNELGVENFLVLNPTPAADYSEQIPNPSPVSRSKSMKLFNIYTPICSLQETGEGGGGGGSEQAEDAPDIGFVFDADGNNCLLLAPGAYHVNSEELLRELNPRHGLTHKYKDDAVYAMLNWLQLLVSVNKAASQPFKGIQDLVNQVLPEKQVFMGVEYAISDERCCAILDLLRGLNTTLVYAPSGQFLRVLDANSTVPAARDTNAEEEDEEKTTRDAEEEEEEEEAEEEEEEEEEEVDTNVYVTHASSSDFIVVNSSNILQSTQVPSALLLTNHTEPAGVTLSIPSIDPRALVDVVFTAQKGLTLRVRYTATTSLNTKKIDEILLEILHKVLLDGKIQAIGAVTLIDGSLTTRAL